MSRYLGLYLGRGPRPPGRRARRRWERAIAETRIELRIAGQPMLGPMSLAQLATVIKYGGYEPGADLLGLEPSQELMLGSWLVSGKPGAGRVELRVWSGWQARPTSPRPRIDVPGPVERPDSVRLDGGDERRAGDLP